MESVFMKFSFQLFFGLNLLSLMGSMAFANDKIILNVKGKEPVVFSADHHESSCGNDFTSEETDSGASELTARVSYFGSSTGGGSVTITYLAGPMAGLYRSHVEVIAQKGHRRIAHIISSEELKKACEDKGARTVVMSDGEVIHLGLSNPFEPLEFNLPEGGVIQFWTRDLHRFPGHPVEISGVKVIW